MTDTTVFNAVEQIEDKDMTIASLRAAIQAQHDGFTLYQNTQQAKYAQLEQALNKARNELSAKPVVSTLDDAINSLLLARVKGMLDSNEATMLIEQAIDQQVERIITKDDFAEEAIKKYLDQAEIDCEEVVQTAIERSLARVEIKFGRRC